MDDLWKKTDKELAKIEKKLEKIYQEAYKDLAEKWDQYMSQANSEVAPFEKAYQKAKESGDAAEIQKAGIALSEAKKKATVQNEYWQGMVNQVAERYEHINETALAYVNGEIPGIYAMNLNGTLHEIETEAGKLKMGVAFDMVDERTVRNLVKKDDSLFPQKKMDKAKDKAWNKKAINSQILQGILQGESIPKIAHRLQNVTDMNAAAATRNARTMCTAAENNGRLSGLKEAEEKGIVYEKQWMATHDDRTRESHQELDGVSVPIDEEFPNGLMYPGDPDGEPEEVYNCRCSLIRKLVGFKKKDGSISEVGEIHQYNPDYFQTAEPEQAAQAEQGEKEAKEAEKPINLNNLYDTMDEKHVEEYKSLIEKSEVRKLYAEYGGGVKYSTANGISKYSPNSKEVYYRLNKEEGSSEFRTLAHENGHYFDDCLQRADFLSFNELDAINDAAGIGIIRPWASSSNEFMGALRHDMEELKKMLVPPEIKDENGNYLSNKTKLGQEILNTKENREASIAIQDAILGFYGEAEGKGTMFYGHDEKYYNRNFNTIKAWGTEKEVREALNEMGFQAKHQKDTRAIIRQYETASETWANVVSAITTGGSALEMSEKYLPETTRACREILKKS